MGRVLRGGRALRGVRACGEELSVAGEDEMVDMAVGGSYEVGGDVEFQKVEDRVFQSWAVDIMRVPQVGHMFRPDCRAVLVS